MLLLMFWMHSSWSSMYMSIFRSCMMLDLSRVGDRISLS